MVCFRFSFQHAVGRVLHWFLLLHTTWGYYHLGSMLYEGSSLVFAAPYYFSLLSLGEQYVQFSVHLRRFLCKYYFWSCLRITILLIYMCWSILVEKYISSFNTYYVKFQCYCTQWHYFVGWSTMKAALFIVINNFLVDFFLYFWT